MSLILQRKTCPGCGCAPGTGSGPNYSCGCASGVAGGITGCDGGQYWPAAFSGGVETTGLSWEWVMGWPSSGSTTQGKVKVTGAYSLVGSASVTQGPFALCGMQQSGLYVKASASNGDSYVFDATGGLPSLRVTHGASIVSQSSPLPIDDLWSSDGDIYCFTTLTAYSDGTAGVGFQVSAPILVWVKANSLSPDGTSHNYHSLLTSGGAPAGPQPFSGNFLPATGGAASSAPIDGSVANICLGAVSTDPVFATTGFNISNADNAVGHINSQTGGKLVGDSPTYPVMAITLSGTTSATVPSNAGCKNCPRGIRFRLVRDSDGVVIIDAGYVQACSQTPSGAYPYNCQWGPLQKLGPALWKHDDGSGTVYYFKGEGDCPTAVSEVLAGISSDWEGLPGYSELKLVLERYTVTVTEGPVPDSACCDCDEGAPCFTCDPTCIDPEVDPVFDENGDEIPPDPPPPLLATWYPEDDTPGTGNDVEIFKTSQSPCGYASADGVSARLNYVPYDGVKQARWQIRMKDPVTGTFYVYEKSCEGGSPAYLGFYDPINGGPGTVEVG